jgi:hypothetical protein
VSIYQYSQGSVVDEVTFVKSDGGSLRAYLHALPDTSEKTLSDISLAMAKRGWQVVPNSMNGKATLEVRGFDRNAQVNGVLFDNKWAHGPAQITNDEKKSTKFADTVKKRSLFLSGIAYLAGDGAFIKYGLKESSPLNIAAGAAYAGGTLSSLLFARKDTPDLQIKEIANKMAAHMREQNIDVPDDCSLKSITEDKNKGFIKTSDDLFRRYPSELMNTFFGIAGACIATAALRNKVFGEVKPKAIEDMLKKEGKNFKKLAPHLTDHTQMAIDAVKKNMRHSGWLDVGLGTMTMASATFGNLVEEKVPDPDSPKKHGMAGVWEWAQERPLAVAGMGYMVSTMCHLASTMKDWKHADSEAKEAVLWRGVFVVTNLLAEALLAISSKGHGKGVVSDKSVDESVISLAAELIAKQPAAQQNHLIDYMSGFLGREDVLAKKDEEVKDLLRTQVELVKKNPWAKCKENLPAAIQTTENKILAPTTNKKNWQATVKSPPQESSPAFFM